MARHKNINDALLSLGYGTLDKQNEILHAAGVTSAGYNVWLPLMYEIENTWFSSYSIDKSLVKDEKEIITQIAIARHTGDDWSYNNWGEWSFGDYHHTIIRQNKIGNTYDYERIGEYCTILNDRKRKITLHARKGAIVTIDRREHNGIDLSWLHGFASSEEDAKDKLNRIIDSQQINILKAQGAYWL